jgi:exopolysaccharide biosynthesis polyprenyl glycosylphosphotransferase
MGITNRVLLDLFNINKSKTHIGALGTMPMITYHTINLNRIQLFYKRILDILGSLVGIVITVTIGLFIAIFIKLESSGPVIFSQNRVGLNGRVFKCYKFRSMYSNAENIKCTLITQNELNTQMMFKMKNDPRITKTGKFIRKTSLDELPQFFNVLKGEMSLVGTRPPTQDEVEHYGTNHRRRISIYPGITGMWQVNGRNNIKDFDKIVKLDTDYIDNWSVFLDIKILLKTIFVVIGYKNSY